MFLRIRSMPNCLTIERADLADRDFIITYRGPGPIELTNFVDPSTASRPALPACVRAPRSDWKPSGWTASRPRADAFESWMCRSATSASARPYAVLRCRLLLTAISVAARAGPEIEEYDVWSWTTASAHDELGAL